MENKKKNILTGAFIAGTIIAGSAFSVDAGNSFKFESLGSGSEVRHNLLNESSKTNLSASIDFVTASDTTKTKKAKTKSKVKEAKCGEGKCGDKKAKDAKKKKGKKKDAKTKEAKTKEAKCGEGKCGN